MRVLLLAPHPFYQERGTPIAVNLLLRVLSERGETVDVLTYHEGSDVSHPGVTIHRIRKPPLVSRVPPGFSLKKLVCDFHMFLGLRALLRHGRYDVIHAVEESVFLAMACRRARGVPLVFDMDSSMPRQIAEKHRWCAFLLPLLGRFERRAVGRAVAVAPMCDALADLARSHGARQVFVLRDISLLQGGADGPRKPLREELGLKGACFMYVGNLEKYQGMDLLLEAFARAARTGLEADLVIAGGKEADIRRCRDMAREQGVGGRVHFLGPQPLSAMPWLFESADVLVSPRISGTNTPMKIYSYLASGKAILATDLPTHTQVLTPQVAVLAPPMPEAFARAMAELAADPERRRELGGRARQKAEQEHSWESFRRQANTLYDWLATVAC